jgi:hypothetical protein
VGLDALTTALPRIFAVSAGTSSAAIDAILPRAESKPRSDDARLALSRLQRFDRAATFAVFEASLASIDGEERSSA